MQTILERYLGNKITKYHAILATAGILNKTRLIATKHAWRVVQ
jgi:hypothetical protein